MLQLSTATPCNHGLGFRNPSKTSPFLNRIGPYLRSLRNFMKYDKIAINWPNITIYIYTYIIIYVCMYIYIFLHQKSIILSPSYEAQEDRMRESLANHMRDSWRRCELQPALDQANQTTKFFARLEDATGTVLFTMF